MEDDYANTISELRNSVQNIRNSINESRSPPLGSSLRSCLSVTTVVGFFIPFILLLLLYLVQPSFVQKKEGNKYVRSGGKVALWTIILTAVVWLGMYLFTFCKGYAAKKVCWN